MNPVEDVCIENGELFTKDTLMECETIDSIEDFNLTQENISFDRIRFNVDGSNIIHYFALDSAKLKLVMDFFENKRMDYL